MDSEETDEYSECDSVDIAHLILCTNADDEILPFDVFTAASVGDLDTFQAGTEDMLVNRCGWVPLMYASYYGHVELVSLLVTNGCNLEAVNKLGRTSLTLAAMCGNDTVVQILIKNGAKLEAQDDHDWTALFYATYLGHHSTVKLLLQHGANPNQRERKLGYSPVILAAAEGHELIMQYLYQHGGKVSATLYSGDTARSLASTNGHTKVVSLIDVYSMRKHVSATLPDLQDGPAKLASLIGGDDRHAHNLQTLFMRKDSIESEAGSNNVSGSNSLVAFLESVGLEKFYKTFEEQDIDLQVFLTLTDSDLKEIGISLLGPRRKMTSAIARWHGKAPLRSSLEEVYADRLEVEMQELGIHLQKACLRIEELQKQLNQEKQLRSLMESCVTQEKAFICETLQSCYDADHCLGMLCAQSSLLQQYLQGSSSSAGEAEILESLVSPVEAINMEVNSISSALKEVLLRMTNRLDFISKTTPTHDTKLNT